MEPLSLSLTQYFAGIMAVCRCCSPCACSTVTVTGTLAVRLSLGDRWATLTLGAVEVRKAPSRNVQRLILALSCEISALTLAEASLRVTSDGSSGSLTQNLYYNCPANGS